jgi:hypothetical protein
MLTACFFNDAKGRYSGVALRRRLAPQRKQAQRHARLQRAPQAIQGRRHHTGQVEFGRQHVHGDHTLASGRSASPRRRAAV